MKTFITKHCILFSIFILIVAIISGLGFFPLLGRFCVSALLIALVCLLKLENTNLFKLKGTLSALITGLPLILLIVAANFMNILFNPELSWDLHPSVNTILVFIIDMLGVGLFEETLMRGTLFNLMKCSWQSKPNGLLKAAIISSSLFGLLHILNFIENPALFLQTASQILYATLIGVYFCGIYVKHQNFIGLVLIHALVDMFGEGGNLFSSFLAESASQDTTPLMSIIQVLIFLPFFFVGLNYLKKAIPTLSLSKTA